MTEHREQDLSDVFLRQGQCIHCKL